MDPADGYTRKTQSDGTIVEDYRRNGELHRDDSPAAIERCADGSIEHQEHCCEGAHIEAAPQRETGANEQTQEPPPLTARERYGYLIQRQNYSERAEQEPGGTGRPKDHDREREQ